jgi:hypothetical protein
MRTKTKIWFSVGAAVVAGSGIINSDALAEARSRMSPELATDTAIPRAPAASVAVAQHTKHGGEAGEEGGEKGAAAKLPPDLAFALRIAQLRGHLLIGDQLVKAGRWSAAMPHFLHPTEEIYGDLQGQLKDYNVPPFEDALKVLASVVKARKGGNDYARAWKTVSDALAAADAGLKGKQQEWNKFVVESALELLKSAAGEYQQAIVKDKIAKPVEYQDARGFIWQAESMIESVAPALAQKDADALKHMRDAFADLKKAFPAPMPPTAPVKDYGAVLGDVSRIELAAGKLM